MTVDGFVAAEKKRLTVWARYVRQTGAISYEGKPPAFPLSDEALRSAFAIHCRRADRHAAKQADQGCANVGDKP